VETVGFHDLAEELQVRVELLSDLARAGKIRTVGNRIVKESADELRWQLAAHKTLLPEDEL
jgi:hypothetical protein